MSGWWRPGLVTRPSINPLHTAGLFVGGGPSGLGVPALCRGHVFHCRRSVVNTALVALQGARNWDVTRRCQSPAHLTRGINHGSNPGPATGAYGWQLDGSQSRCRNAGQLERGLPVGWCHRQLAPQLLARAAGFPKPVARLGRSGHIQLWYWPDVAHWAYRAERVADGAWLVAPWRIPPTSRRRARAAERWGLGGGWPRRTRRPGRGRALVERLTHHLSPQFYRRRPSLSGLYAIAGRAPADQGTFRRGRRGPVGDDRPRPGVKRSQARRLFDRRGRTREHG